MNPERGTEGPKGFAVARLKSGDKPAIVDSHNFGVVRPGTENVHSFRISNITTHAWKISEVVNTCACIVSEVSSKTIKPGGSVELTVKYRAPEKEVADRRRVYVAMDDPKSPIIALEIRALVREEVHVFPKRLALTEVRIGESRIENISIANYGGADWESVEVQPSAEWLNLELKSVDSNESEPAGQRYEIIAQVDTRKLPPGRCSSKIKVTGRRGGEDIELADIPVDITCLAWGTLIPPELFIGKVRPGTIRRDMAIRLAEPLKDPQQLRLDSEGIEGVRLVIVASRSASEIRPTIELIVPGTPGFYTGILTYSVSSRPDLPPLHQKVSFLVE
jgi:Protein of unknown function (DUF1573)